MAKEISYIIGKKSYTPKRNVLDRLENEPSFKEMIAEYNNL